MRISTPWTAAVLLCAVLVSTPIQSTPLQPASSPTQPMPAFASRLDETQKNWSRLAESTEERPFVVDQVNFMAQHNLAFVEFYVQISYMHLSFTRVANLFQAVYDVDLYIADLNGSAIQAQSLRDTVKVFTYDETKMANSYRVTLLSFCLRPGEYRLRAIVTDQETGKASEVAQKFSARDFSGQSLLASDLQFSRNIQIDSSASPFNKHNRRVEPNAMHRYGQFASQLFIYYEIYNLAEPLRAEPTGTAATNDDSVATRFSAVDSFRTLFLIRDEQGKEIKQLWKSNRKPGNSCVQSVMLPIADLKSGLYTLTVRVFDNRSGSYTETSGRFTVAWSLFSFKDKKFEEILEQMRYIANREELRELAKLPEADRQRGLVEFWQRRDPTPATPENEVLDEYYRRVAYANRHFKWQYGEGWKSPQGQIYITYGPPDEISRWSKSSTNDMSEGGMQPAWPFDLRQETSARPNTERHPHDENAAYELWEYVQLNRRFVFADFRGMGCYQLIDPILLGKAWFR